MSKLKSRDKFAIKAKLKRIEKHMYVACDLELIGLDGYNIFKKVWNI